MADAEATPPGPGRGRRVLVLTAAFAAGSLALAAFQWPRSMSFEWFAFGDLGANLTVQRLLDRGLVPSVDFGYLYGLLPLLVGRAWFAAFGRTPAAYVAAMVVFDVLIAWGLARCVAALRAGPAGVALVLAALPSLTLHCYLNFTHALESALIVHALADHAGGHRPRALALLAACLFVKPALAYVYGLLLLLLILRSAAPAGPGAVARALRPAAATGLLTALVLAAAFGPTVVVRSLLPLSGAETYRQQNYGFFHGAGRAFWLPPRPSVRFYLATHAGHYLAGSLVLPAAGAAALARLARRPGTTDLGGEIVACTATMHVVFVTTFYASWASWTYYYFVLVVGLVAVSTRGRRAAVLIGVLALAAAVGHKEWFNYNVEAWRRTSPSPETAGLWATAVERDDLRRLRAAVGGQTASFLTPQGGCFERLVPGFAEPENFFLNRGIPIEADLERKTRQVAAAPVVVIREAPGTTTFLKTWPEFRAALEGCELVWSRHAYRVYRRTGPPSGRAAGGKGPSEVPETVGSP